MYIFCENDGTIKTFLSKKTFSYMWANFFFTFIVVNRSIVSEYSLRCRFLCV